MAILHFFAPPLFFSFFLPGGLGAQTFEGQDYSAEGRAKTAAGGPIIDKMLLLEVSVLMLLG
jgi:hypothetical protein